MKMKNNRITICACASRSFFDKDKVAEVAANLQNEGYEVTVVPDLCKAAMRKSEEMREMADGVIIACYPRAIHSHLHRLGLTANTLIDVRNSSVDEVLAQFRIIAKRTEIAQTTAFFREIIQTFPVEEGTDAWYPTLDKERCTECGKCHDFCLFGVYAIENKQVKVTQPQNCKNNCPACARMCPSKAIIFPKYEKSPINGGTEDEEVFNPEEMNKMYRERLQMRLLQRRASVSLLKKRTNDN